MAVVALAAVVLVFAWLLAGAVGVILTAAVLWQTAQSYRLEVPLWSRVLGWPITVVPWAAVIALRLRSGWQAWLLAVLVWGLLIYLGRSRDSD